MKKLEIGAIYEHYKGTKVKVIGECLHSETLEELVIYKALYESEEFGKDAIWARPKEMFLGTMVVNGKEIKRFEKINER